MYTRPMYTIDTKRRAARQIKKIRVFFVPVTSVFSAATVILAVVARHALKTYTYQHQTTCYGYTVLMNVTILS